MIDRRMFLAATALTFGALATFGHSGPAFAENGVGAFSFDALVDKMRDKAGKAFAPETPELPQLLVDLDYDAHRAIRFRPEKALWSGSEAKYQLQAFHPGWLFKEPVELFEIDNGQARSVHFRGADFEYREPLDPAIFADLDMPGIAGFRLHYPLNTPEYFDELVAFLGGSYFRALGKETVYGLSARGLAIDSAAGSPEEFPRFTRFYLEKPGEGAAELRLYAELESARVTGAYQFTIKPGVNTVIEVDARVFLREDVARLGIAPLTSMFLFGENDRVGFDDYRPEVHDNDGLLVLRQDGRRLWRPVRNPDSLALSLLGEDNPKGFGLLQRDRSFDHYQDTEAKYEHRPSLWIEPINDWGAGQIMLAEIPADKEIYDNIVALWVPEGQALAGAEYRFAYRMIWGFEPEPGTELGQVVRTSTGHGGAAASEPRPNLRKFVVEFDGDALANLGADSPLEPRLSVQNGTVMTKQLQRIEGGTWRFIVDIKRHSIDVPVELILALALYDTDVTETWMYQWSANT